MILPTGYTVDDAREFVALTTDRFLVSFGEEGALYAWSSDTPVQIESSGARNLLASAPPGIGYYLIDEAPAQGDVRRVMVKRLESDLTDQTIGSFESDSRVYLSWADAAYDELSVRLEGRNTHETWTRRHGEARWERVSSTATPAAPPLDVWVEVDVLEPSSADYTCANFIDWSWQVENERGDVEARLFLDVRRDPLPFWIRPWRAKRGERRVMEVDDGYLVGFDEGEWGGGAWWYSPDGTESHLIFSDNIAGFAQLPGEVVAVGLESVHRLERAATGRWRRRESVKLLPGAEPFSGFWTFDAVTDPEGGLLVGSKRGVFRYAGGRIERLSTSNWVQLYPNSMALDSAGRIFLGMRYVVVRLDPATDGYRETWLASPDCVVLDRLPNHDCRCSPLPPTVVE